VRPTSLVGYYRHTILSDKSKGGLDASISADAV
jgi:hypothetical protein